MELSRDDYRASVGIKPDGDVVLTVEDKEGKTVMTCNAEGEMTQESTGKNMMEITAINGKPVEKPEEEKEDEHNQGLTVSYLAGYQRGKDDTKQEIVDVLSNKKDKIISNRWFNEDELAVVDDIAEKLNISLDDYE